MQIHVAQSIHRLALAVVPLVAPRFAGRLYGLDFAKHTEGAELVRLMAARNLGLGAALLLAKPSARPLLAQVNLAVDAIDVVTICQETRRRAIPRRATVIGAITAVSGVALGIASARRTQ